MPPKVVDPAKIQTLRDWVAHYPKYTNVRFNPETGEPAVYSNADFTTIVKTFAWERQADAITVLTQPTQFPLQVLDSAVTRMREFSEEQTETYEKTLPDLQAVEQQLMKARMDGNKEMVVKADLALLQLERSIAPVGRVHVTSDDKKKSNAFIASYVSPLPFKRRAIPLAPTGADTA
jgi:hypothetical protein